MKISSVVVLYRPDEETLKFLVQYASSGNSVVAVWNEAPQDAAGNFLDRQPLIEVLHNAKNIGLATALNQGIECAFRGGAQRVLLLDQDSRPSPDMANHLSEVYDKLLSEGVDVALVGPTLVDKKASGRVNAAIAAEEDWLAVSGLSTSGSLIDKGSFERVGPMWDPFFIDCIDHEWCYRAQSRNMVIAQSQSVKMAHDMGDAGINFFGRYKPIHRSPVRHFYIIRNSLWLFRMPHVPGAFKRSELAKMVYRIPAYFCFSTAKLASLSAIFRGLYSGLFAFPSRAEEGR